MRSRQEGKGGRCWPRWRSRLLVQLSPWLAHLVLFAATAAEADSTTTVAIGMRIVNGDDVDIVDYPYQVSIEKSGRHSCGGAIISKNWVISARHCFPGSNSEKAMDFRVRAGSTLRQFGGSLHPVDRILVHPGPAGYDYDISVLHVTKPFEFSQTVQQGELPPQVDGPVPARRRVQVTGYGALQEHSRLSKRLLKADLTTWDRKNCSDLYEEKAKQKITDRMICAGNPLQDACQGDSGGPLSTGPRKLVGVVSFGMGCGKPGFPGVYTNLAHKDIRSFIKDNTGI
ncbi:trypsin-1-like isoform X2 [Frankliniella occidentalis]|uniref:Trypsin-1-like isoform X2 n=1 Tax=Frankliniella occidentalis TaxID=133901 RepID=A0A6J1SAJ0_FRAOC|nr:trypsin-1-like isoform X2 [Frankliniella occidentalis]